MDIKTLLNEGLDMNKKDRVNLRGSLKEGFEEGQPELDLDMTASSGKKYNIEDLKLKMMSYGSQVGSKYTPIITSLAKGVLKNLNRDMGVDMDANSRVYDMEEDDLLMEDDRFFDIVAELCEAFLEGMQDEWPFPILDE